MSRGLDRERQVKQVRSLEGWVSARSAGSKVFDLMSARARPGGPEVQLVEVKSTAKGPYEQFGPGDREKLRLLAHLAGAEPLLAWWPPRGSLTWIPATDWPS